MSNAVKPFNGNISIVALGSFKIMRRHLRLEEAEVDGPQIKRRIDLSRYQMPDESELICFAKYYSTLHCGNQ